MSKSASKTLIGAFVVGAVTLLVIALAVFGSGMMFNTTTRYVVFFDSSISGLSVGSPVMFRGVPVGRVVEIRLTGDLGSMVFQTPVYIELDNRKEEAFQQKDSDISTREYLDRLVAHGLRASLATQSLVTGQLMIEMNFYPPTELRHQIKTTPDFDDIPEIPTIPSKLDNIWQKVTTLPIEGIVSNILEITDGVNQILKATDTQRLTSHMDALLIQMQNVTANVDKTLVSIQGLSDSYSRLATNADRRIGGTFDEADKALATFASTAKEAEQVMTSARTIVGKNSATMVQINQTLREMADAARAVRVLANTLERNPEALLRGKAK